MARTFTSPNPRRAPTEVTSLAVNESVSFAPDGNIQYGIEVSGIRSTEPDFDRFEVYAQVSGADTDDWHMVGWGRTVPVHCEHPMFVKGATYNIAMVTVSFLGATLGPDGSTQTSITLAGTGLFPSDVAGFTATVENGQVLFSWTAVASDLNPDVMGYEIRAGATGWSSATVVGVFGPRGRPWASVPRSKATGTSFYIKAVTRLGDYSSAVGSATLSAASATCVDNDSLVGYQEVTIAGGARTVTVTTRCPYAAAPYITATASVNGRSLALTTHTYSQNGDLTWSFTLRASANAPSAGSWTVHVHEAGA